MYQPHSPHPARILSANTRPADSASTWPKAFSPRKALALVSAALVLVSFTACVSTAGRNQAVSITKTGAEVCEKTIRVLEKCSELERESKLVERELLIINSNGMPVPEMSTLKDIQAELKQRVEAYQALGKVYAQFSLLASTDYGAKTKEGLTALTQSVNSLGAITVLDNGSQSLVSNLGALAVSSLQAGDIQKHNQVLFELVSQFSAAWEKDEPALLKRIDTLYQHQADLLRGISKDRFDKERLEKVMDDPYSGPILVELYKSRQELERSQKGAELKEELRTIGRSLAKLAGSHGELAKQQPSLQDVFESLDRILKAIETI